MQPNATATTPRINPAVAALRLTAARFADAYPSEASVITRAEHLALASFKASRWVQCIDATTYEVEGSRGASYRVTPGACTCPARRRCYHRWACSLLAELGDALGCDALPLAGDVYHLAPACEQGPSRGATPHYRRILAALRAAR